MPRRRRWMSEALRDHLARELGVAHQAARAGWGAVSARDCGRLVREAVLRAEAWLAAHPDTRPSPPANVPVNRVRPGHPLQAASLSPPGHRFSAANGPPALRSRARGPALGSPACPPATRPLGGTSTPSKRGRRVVW